ncbi:hypothetical protein HZH68_013754 [Vespula germanica]|uniref:Uncharacterized protein n=1 Tax=Vespula germanica TaxID=30212 RepID=A0A834MVM5_VESGE|nr:hypothetical protein HZH68_013754 [Vespula germanica]
MQSTGGGPGRQVRPRVRNCSRVKLSTGSHNPKAVFALGPVTINYEHPAIKDCRVEEGREEEGKGGRVDYAGWQLARTIGILGHSFWEVGSGIYYRDPPTEYGICIAGSLNTRGPEDFDARRQVPDVSELSEPHD